MIDKRRELLHSFFDPDNGLIDILIDSSDEFVEAIRQDAPMSNDLARSVAMAWLAGAGHMTKVMGKMIHDL
jgi:hypothetical protein